MTTSLRGLAAGVVLAGCAVGLASPASAELTDGTYQLTWAGDPAPSKGLVVTSCGEGCKHTQMVGAAEPVDFHLQGNIWTPVDAAAPVTIDNNTLAGVNSGDAFQLTKIS